MEFNEVKILLVDGGDRQTLPLARAFKELGCKVATLNSSRLDLGYVSRYPDEKILDKTIHGNKAAHVKAIRKCIETRKYNIVVTTSDDTAEELSLMKEEYKDVVKIDVNSPELFYMAYDKNNTMKACMENGVPCPKTYFDVGDVESLLSKQIQYPIVVKPRKGFGAIGFHKVDDENQLRALCESIKEDIGKYVFQEYIPQTGTLYKCDMFVDDKNEIKSVCVYSKNRWFPIDGGSSVCNVTVERPDIIESCSKLLKAINWRGVADFDLIEDPRDGLAKIIEINPRTPACVKIVFKAGVNLAQQILEYALGMQVSSFMTYGSDVCLRCIHTDVLWFLKSKNRFSSKPSWFSWKRTNDQIFDVTDPLPFVTFSIQAILKYKREMKKRAR